MVPRRCLLRMCHVTGVSVLPHDRHRAESSLQRRIRQETSKLGEKNILTLSRKASARESRAACYEREVAPGKLAVLLEQMYGVFRIRENVIAKGIVLHFLGRQSNGLQ